MKSRRLIRTKESITREQWKLLIGRVSSTRLQGQSQNSAKQTVGTNYVQLKKTPRNNPVLWKIVKSKMCYTPSFWTIWPNKETCNLVWELKILWEFPPRVLNNLAHKSSKKEANNIGLRGSKPFHFTEVFQLLTTTQGQCTDYRIFNNLHSFRLWKTLSWWNHFGQLWLKIKLAYSAPINKIELAIMALFVYWKKKDTVTFKYFTAKAYYQLLFSTSLS